MTRAAARPPTGIVMLNLGGPRALDEVGPFLLRLFADREIINLPMQSVLGPFIARRRTPRVQALYQTIGGGSPILHWTELQGEGMVARLDRMLPESAPHRFYVAFRYTSPTGDEALLRMQADGVRRAVAFTQYPQFSCATTGSSLNELWRAAARTGLTNAFDWSVIDRWPVHELFIDAVVRSVRDALLDYPAGDRDDVVLLFSAHSLPLHIVDRGDPYPQEVGTSVHETMLALGVRNDHLLAYQSEVGPVRWLGPSTEQLIRKLAAQGRRNVLVIPIAFTSDHIETLSEIDIEYAHLARTLGMTGFRRAPALNGSEIFLDALADIVATHLRSGELCSPRYVFRCPGCHNPVCRRVGTTSNEELRALWPRGTPRHGELRAAREGH